MKKQSWKYFVGRKLIATACGAGLLLFTGMSASAGLIAFDTLGDGDAIPSGYSKLQWDNFSTLDAVAEGASGYRAGMISKKNVAYNRYGEPASIYVKNGSFKPVMAFMTAAWNDNLEVQIDGYLKGRLVFSHTYILSATKPTLIVFGGARVDTLDFTSSGGTYHGYYGHGEHFAMDNLLVQ
jgi:hypothetical protein